MRRLWCLLLGAVLGALLYRRLRAMAQEEGGAEEWLFSGSGAWLYDRVAGCLLVGLYDQVARETAVACPSGEVLDVGCGPGHVAMRLAEIAPGLRVTGVDISPAMVEIAARHAEERGLAGRVGFREGDVQAMPFPDRQFDLVVSTFSLHHWPDPAKGLAEIHRVLRPSGQARIYDLPDWVRQHLHGQVGGPALARLAAASPFGGGVVAVVRWPDRLPTVRCLHLRRTS